MIDLSVTKNEENQRLDRFLRKYLRNASLSFIYKLIRKDVKVNGRREKAETILKEGDRISLYISEEMLESYRERKTVTKARKQFRIAFEDENVLVVEKPYGLLTHGDQKEKKNTLANQVLSYLIETEAYVPRMEKTFVPSPVNRLDRNTTGLVIFGKNHLALQSLNRMIREKEVVKKYYLTIVAGEVKQKLHLSDRMVKDSLKNKITIVGGTAGSDTRGAGNFAETGPQSESAIVADEGKNMETIVRPLEYNKGYTLVEVELLTGRSHQIRAHLQKAGHCIIGDEKYGDPRINRKINERFGWNTQFLHAYRLYFAGAFEPLMYLEGLEVTAPLNEKMQSIKQELFGP